MFLALISSVNVQAQRVVVLTPERLAQLSAQGYALGIELGCAETSYGQNFGTHSLPGPVLATINWADAVGIPIYGEGVMIGYSLARFGSAARSQYCGGGGNGSNNGGGDDGGGTGPIGPIG